MRALKAVTERQAAELRHKDAVVKVAVTNLAATRRATAASSTTTPETSVGTYMEAIRGTGRHGTPRRPRPHVT